MTAVLEEVAPERLADELLLSAAKELKGTTRRQFISKVCDQLCDGNVRQAEYRFGWGRKTIEQGALEREACSDAEGESPVVTSGNRGKQRSEVANPQLAIDIRLIVEPNSHCDPELKTDRVYTNMTSREVHQALKKRGYSGDQLPSPRTLRDILNRMNFRLKRIRKGKPIKKTEHTDAIFENLQKVRQQAASEPETLEISVDTKAKVKLGKYSLGGKNTDRLRR